jgi:plastocyanin
VPARRVRKEEAVVRRVLAVGTAALLALAAATSVLAASGSVGMAEQNDKYLFTPAKAFVNVGQSVTWTNGTDAPHTVTSDSGGELASGTIAANGTFSHTFATAGSFAYHCTIHTYMTGEIVVLAAGVTPPPTDALGGSSPSSGVPVGPIAFVLALGGLGSLLVVRRIAGADPS